MSKILRYTVGALHRRRFRLEMESVKLQLSTQLIPLYITVLESKGFLESQFNIVCEGDSERIEGLKRSINAYCEEMSGE